MGKIIDLKGYKDKALANRVDRLALLSVFYFKDEYGEEVKDLEEEVKYALVIMTYKFLSAAHKDGTVIINKKGFSIEAEVKEELKLCIESAIKVQSVTMN